MALVFCDGFDHYQNGSNEILTKWNGAFANYGTSQFDVQPKWSRAPGGMGIYMSGGYDGGSYVTRNFGANYASFVSGFNANIDNTAANTIMISWMDAGTSQLNLGYDGANHLVLTRNGTVLATSSNTLTSSTWYFFEIKATINNTSGAYEVRVNGSSTGWIPSATSQNTRGSSNNFINQARIFRTQWKCDDFYVFDQTGSVGNDFTNGARIITIYPNAIGNYAQWTGNYTSNFANLNELAAHGDLLFNMSNTAGQKDSFSFDDIPTATVHGIQQVLQARQDAGSPRILRPIQRSGGTDYNGTSFTLAGSHLFYLDPKSVNPATSAGYTASDVNGAEFGYELVS